MGFGVHGPARAGHASAAGSGCRGGPGARSGAPFPDWASYERHSIWIYDTTRFARCKNTYVVMIMDLVTRKWITELVSAEETGLQVQLAFTHALELEGLLDRVDAHQAPARRPDRRRPRAARCCSPSPTTGRR